MKSDKFSTTLHSQPSDIADIRRVSKENVFRTVAENASSIIWLADDSGNCIYLNPAWQKITGKSSIEGFQNDWQHAIHPDDRKRVISMWSNSIKTKKAFLSEYRLLTKEQEFIQVSMRCTPLSEGDKVSGYVCLLEDISLQRNAAAVLENETQKRTNDLTRKNEELRRSEERYQKMIAEIQDYAIILLDRDGIIQNWNKGAQHIKGWSAEEAVGMNFRIFYTPDDQKAKLPEKLIDVAVKNGKANHEGWRVRKDGTRFWGSIVITSIHDSKNEVIGFSKVTRDLTERKLAEEAFRKNADEIQHKNKELEKMNQELASFAYVSSHDLQEPLRKIQTFASRIIETEKSLSDKGKDYFGRMQNAAFRMQTLIEDLLAYSRTNTSEKKFERVDLNNLLSEVKSDLKERIEEKRAKITTDKLPTIDVIAFQFRQLLMNILSNAIKFSKPDVAPAISIDYSLEERMTLGQSNPENRRPYHHFEIRDNGIGFEPEHQHKIFEVFQRLHGRSEYSGTGIGLAICKKIVENHQGMIYAESELGQGATFHILIPESRA